MTGIVAYNRVAKDVDIIKPALEDEDDNGEWTLSRIYGHFLSFCNKNEFKETYLIAFG